MNFSALIFSLNTIILFLFVCRIRRVIIKEEMRRKYIKSAQKTPRNLLIDYFYKTISILAISYLIFSIDLLFFSTNKYLFSPIKIIGDIFLYVSFAYGVNIPLYLRFPKFRRRDFITALLSFSLLLIIYQIFFPPTPEIIKGVIFWNVGLLVGGILYVFAVTMWLPTGIIFLQEGFKRKKEFLRYLLLGSSFIIISLFSPLILVTESVTLVIISHILMTIGYLFLFSGMFFYKRTLKK